VVREGGGGETEDKRGFKITYRTSNQTGGKNQQELWVGSRGMNAYGGGRKFQSVKGTWNQIHRVGGGVVIPHHVVK